MSEENQVPTAPVVKTKEEKLAAIKAQIEKLEKRYDDVLNDRVPQPAAKKVAYMPEVGASVLATVGRNTATSKATVEEGTVVAVKAAVVGEDGKVKSAAQVRVRIKAGTFDEQLITLYPAQLVANEFNAQPADSAE